MEGKHASELQKVQDLMKDGKYEEAQPILEELGKSNPDDPLVIRLLGNTFAYTGFLGKAKKVWKEGLKKFPTNIDLLYNYGLAFYLQGNFPKAKIYWKKALKLNADDAEIFFNMGQVMRDEGQLRKAIAYWKKAIARDPENVETMNNLGVAFSDLNMFGAATTWFNRALAKDQDYALAHFNLANSMIEKGELDEAKIHAEKAAELDPSTHLKQVEDLLKKIQAKKANAQEEL